MSSIEDLLEKTGLSLSSSEFAQHLDSLALNEQTGLTSTRDLYELPRRGEMGARGEDAGE